MNSLYRILLIISALLITVVMDAQFPSDSIPASNTRYKKLKITSDSLLIDTASIIPNTFSITDLPATDYRLDFVKAILYWKKKPETDSVMITYRVFPFQAECHHATMRYDSVKNNFYVKPFEFNSGSDAMHNGASLILEH